ncbi:hypothetical protein [Luteipulveratus halotolerans]|uniref:Uncharacterized protein n=1 Tax=Luteipulveratus halotolerans TaxID=1631356 RepID=A0A0L6CML6_9MICO|nr:hypothetical protein [Luteipulveratus halotolerans]KNX38905.1 hypothetical protein VV01_20070 [Luteipulveratus halotolerans]
MGDLVRGRGRLIAVLAAVALVVVLVAAKVWPSDTTTGCTKDASGAPLSAHDAELTSNPIVQRVAQGVAHEDARRYLDQSSLEVPSKADAERVAKSLDKNGHCINA